MAMSWLIGTSIWFRLRFAIQPPYAGPYGLARLSRLSRIQVTYRFLIHDRDRIFSQQLDQGIRHLGLRVLKTPVWTPQANALCERLIGTLRRECLDFVMPLTENHLYRILKEWV